MSTATNKKNNYAYTTLITKPSYLAGVIILAYTLRKQNSQYPLVVLYTDALTADSVTALQNESEKLNLVLKKTDALLPRSDVKITLIAERFGDTWYIIFSCFVPIEKKHFFSLLTSLPGQNCATSS